MSDKPQPPYVVFETRAVEDRTASIDAGHFIPRDVHYAIVTPAGTKDRIEKVASEWLEGLREGVAQDRFPPEWLRAYEERYKAFLESRELPEDGTPVLNWTSLSPAQVKLLLDLNIRTVEQMAEATEEAMSRIGMGGRALKSQAKAWLDSAKGQGKLAGELNSLRSKNEELEASNAQMRDQLKTLQSQVEALTAKADA